MPRTRLKPAGRERAAGLQGEQPVARRQVERVGLDRVLDLGGGDLVVVHEDADPREQPPVGQPAAPRRRGAGDGRGALDDRGADPRCARSRPRSSAALGVARLIDVSHNAGGSPTARRLSPKIVNSS
jgi:hypothetical protein